MKTIKIALLFWFTVISIFSQPIDRESLVKRHIVATTGTLCKSPAQVGNGHFAFGVDITGLQTFTAFNTLSDWSWHSFPMKDGMKLSDYKPVKIKSYGKEIAYMTSDPQTKEITKYLSQNPHRFNLGRIGFIISDTTGKKVEEVDLKNCRQIVDIWTGIIKSRFEFNKKPVLVETACSPDKDIIGVNIKSELLKDTLLKVYFDFPYPDTKQFPNYIGRFDTVNAHKSIIENEADNFALIHRQMDSVRYYVFIKWSDSAYFKREDPEKHRFILSVRNSDNLSFTCHFSPSLVTDEKETVEHIKEESAKSWKSYWMSGAAVDFSGSKDYRWFELERRIVLSQYLMRVNECGYLPPQESGLVNNGWYGRFHFEMIWWHCLHYALWNRMDMYNSYLDIYRRFLSGAKERAKSENRSGARWPKCTGNFNREWPGRAHGFLLWQEPHPIYFAETDYRINKDKETLDKWKNIVFNTADYMADNVFYDKKKKKYVLGPPIYIVSENTDPMVTTNPTFELSYWMYGLRTALNWEKRLGLPLTRKWEKVLNNISDLPIEDSVYVTYEGIKDMWTKYNYEHPAILGIYGMLPGDGIKDMGIFKKTFYKVINKWQFDKIWGWDYPMIAMAAAKLGDRKIAMDMLLTDSYNFQFDEHGLATGGPFPYFPSNGGMLTAIAMMCEGWDGSVGKSPGILNDGSWSVRYEGFNRMQ